MDITKLFIQLASISSPSGKEKEIGKIIASILQPYADELYVDQVGNIYAYINGTGTKPLLLCAHMDTVEPAGEQMPIIKEGVIHSNGKVVLGADDKAAVAAIITAVSKIKSGKFPHSPIEILITVREETDAGIKDFPRNKLKSKHALLADIGLSTGTVITSAPYVLGYSMNVTTPGSHIARITNSTVHPLRFLEKFIERVPFGKLQDHTVVNIAKVQMGESYNSIPQSLYFTGEIRTFDNHTYNDFIANLDQVQKSLDVELGTVSTLTKYPYCTGYDLSSKDLTHIKKTLAELNIKSNFAQLFSVGDFNILAEWGITPINIGTGAMDCHTTRERISIEALQTLESIFFSYITTYA